MEDLCKCTSPAPWTTSTGHKVCQNCARLMPDSPRGCQHIRSRITETGMQCVACGHEYVGLGAGFRNSI